MCDYNARFCIFQSKPATPKEYLNKSKFLDALPRKSLMLKVTKFDARTYSDIP
jgi:hypothetical protein